LLDASLVELSKGQNVSAPMTLAKKDIFGNWIECHMCEDYPSVNKQTHLDKYAMALLEEIFYALGQAKVFSTLDLKHGYH
jgi:hypothetical protein